MQARFIHDGNAIDYRPDSDVSAGDVVVQEQLVGIAKVDIPAGTLGALAVTGVFEMPKPGGDHFLVGHEVTWDNDAKIVVFHAPNEAGNVIGKVVKEPEINSGSVLVRLGK